jgi:16S rRNA (guanine527-N7)-methyltransferase
VVKDFAFAEARSQKPEARVADLGSGAGFPGIPIKLWAPQIALTLIESSHKKATFLREVARALTLADVNIQNARAETLPPGTFDLVTLRAVERFANILGTASSLLAPSSWLALLISSAQLDPARSALPNLSWQPPIPIPNSESRQLLIGHREPRK